MRLVGGRLGRRATRELEGRERPDELGMHGVDMGLDIGQQRVFVPGLQDLPAPALDVGCHPNDKTS